MPKRTRASNYSTAAAFIRRNRAGMLATTARDGKPHAAIVYCMVHDDLTVYFTTRAEGRKFESLSHNADVCMLFTGHQTLQQLQLSGKARRVSDKEQTLDLLHELMKLRYRDKSLPRPAVNLIEPGVRKEYALFCVTPYEMTYVDFETSRPGEYKPDFQQII